MIKIFRNLFKTRVALIAIIAIIIYIFLSDDTKSVEKISDIENVFTRLEKGYTLSEPKNYDLVDKLLEVK